MKKLDVPALRVAIYEGAGAEPLAAGERASLVRALLDKGYPVTVIRPGGRANAPASGRLVVLGRFTDDKPAEAEGSDGSTVHFRRINGQAPEQVVALVAAAAGELNAPTPGGWKPCFPVIDYGRCTNCMQCLSFCLFDVYAAPEGKINVQKPSNCKTDCPACSRVCPEVAILFPKYKAGPINGDEVREADMKREAMKVDISALLGGDIYAALRQRSATAKARFSAERDEKKALEERKRCLAKLQAGLGIPQEVMDSLPSLEQIQAKAAAAIAKAE